MHIDTKEILNYLQIQRDSFERLGSIMPDNQFNKGVLEGLNFVKQFILIMEEREGTAIAKERGE